MSDNEGGYSSAEVVRSLKRIESKVDGIAAGYVPRGEFDARMTAVDREIRDLKDAQQASRAPWWQVAPIVIATAALVLTLIVTFAAK